MDKTSSGYWSSKYAGNVPLSYFGFKSIGIKGKKGQRFPVNKAGRPFKKLYPVRQRNMSAKEVSSEAVVVVLYKDDGMRGALIPWRQCNVNVIRAPRSQLIK